ncbi:OmpH family outer membrane protein [Algirhabdus cladophorae]|uniref:OmpH family outer membrane protein n=1 Tax=Algirhabdus cladophorae TaxID=3377108 RepID=UPI003B849B76
MRVWLMLLALAASLCGAASAQTGGQPQFPIGQLPTPILTVEPDRLFSQSDFGIRIADELAREREILLEDKTAIENQLRVEEQQLTDQRADLSAAEFTALADAFDQKVQQLRRDQDERSRAFSAKLDRSRQDFFAFALPVLADMVRQSGAVAILERRTVFLAADAIDITDQAIARINTELGDGLNAPQ